MKSATLHFERGIFAKSVLRFWPIWAVYAFIWMLVLPVSIIDTLTRWTATDANSLVLNSIPNTAVMLCPAAACAAAMAVFSHLYSERSAGFFAALPVDRGSMFLSLAAAGLLPLMAANLLVFLVSLAVEALFGASGLGALAQWLGAVSLLTLCYFGLAALCAQLTGHMVIMPLLFIAVNVVASALGDMGLIVPSMFCYGYVNPGSNWANVLSPLVNLISNVYTTYGATDQVTLAGWSWMMLYGLLGAMLLPASMALYKRRNIESAGDVVAIASVRPVFKYVCALACAFILGNMLYTLPFGNSPRDGLGPALVYSACMAAGAFIGYFGAEMLLSKSFAVFGSRRSYIGWALTGLLCCVFVVSCELDATGYETNLPDPSKVSSVTVDTSGISAVFDESEHIEAAISLHENAIEGRKTNEEAERGGWSGVSVYLQYRMADGSEMMRRYFIAGTDTDTLTGLEELMNSNEGIASRKEAWSQLRPSNVTEAFVYFRPALSEDGIQEEQALELTSEEAAELYNTCILPDMREAKIGLVWYVTDETYYNSVYDCRIELNVTVNSGSGRQSTYFYTVPTVYSERTNEWLLAHGVELNTLAETASASLG